MAVIFPTILVNISRDPNIIENVFIRVECTPEEIQIYTDLFQEFKDVFAWSYEEMSGIDPFIIHHEIKTDRKSTRLNSSHLTASRMPSSA